jgi:hypothetical protein
LTLEPLEQRFAPAVFNVNSTLDLLNPPAGVVTLRSAIEAANATPGGNTINLTVSGIYKITIPGANEDANATGDFDILPSGGDLTITNTSSGAIVVDGNQLDRVFDINPSYDPANPTPMFAVTLQGFTIQNGNALSADAAAGSGGGIRDQGNASLTLNYMVVTNNSATAEGGGIAMEHTAGAPWTLTLHNTTISANRAGGAGGGVETDGSGIVSVSYSTIVNNTAVNAGGGIWLDAIAAGAVLQSATLNVTGSCLIEGNHALAANSVGGGIGNAGNGSVSIAMSTVQGNSSGGMGGGFADESNQGSLAVVDSNFLGNVAGGDGGGIVEGGSASITNSTVQGNSSGANGGGFAGANHHGALTIANSVFLDNGASRDGGGIAVAGPSTFITDSAIEGNTSGGSGGGIFAGGDTLNVQSSTVANNTARGSGGGIELATAGVDFNASTITNTTIAANSVLNTADAGGGLDAGPGFTGVLKLLNDTINANAAAAGGGVFWAGTAGSLFGVQNTILAGNRAVSGPDASNPVLPAFTDLGGNVIGVSGSGSGNTGFHAATTQTGTSAAPLDPLLGPLQDNGGPSAGSQGIPTTLETEALSRGSPAIARGGLNGTPASDERGFARVINGAVDAGAVTQDERPAITNVDNVTFTVGQAGSFTFTTTGFPAPALSEVVVPPVYVFPAYHQPGWTWDGPYPTPGTLPNGLRFVDNGDGTATLSGTPAAGAGGSYTLIITAHNGHSPDATQSFMLTIQEAPAITSPNTGTLVLGQIVNYSPRISNSYYPPPIIIYSYPSITFTVTTNGFPRPTLTETGALPAGVTFADNHNGTAAFSADLALRAGGGIYHVTLTAHNGLGADASQNFTLVVELPLEIDYYDPKPLIFAVGRKDAFTLTGGGSPIPSLSEVGALPSGITFFDNHNGTATLAGMPAAGTGGLYRITVTAHNGVGPDAVQNFYVPVQQAPAITSAADTTFTVGRPGTFTVTDTGFGAPALSESGALPAGLTFNPATGVLSGTPAAGSAGAYKLTFTASNGVGPNATQTFTLSVLTPQAHFVQALYLDELGRSGDLSSLSDAGFWVQVLSDGIANQATVAAAIEHSPEARAHLVAFWYQSYLGRQALNGEGLGLVNLLLQGQTEEQVLSDILGSPEFFNHTQALIGSGTPPQREVAALYRLLLNRTASPGEVTAWVNAMSQPGAPGVAMVFLDSSEFRTRLFTSYYNVLVHRPPDILGLNALVFSKFDADVVRLGLEASGEFFANG